MPRPHLFLAALLCFCLGGCSLFDLGSSPDPDVNGDEVQPTIVVSGFSTVDLTSDPFEIKEVIGLDTTASGPFISTYVDGTLTSDTLTLRVTYGGGCAEHRFRLYASRLFSERNPVGSDAFLAHDDGGDTCEAAAIPETLRFDLAPLREAYQRDYRRQHGVIDLILYLGERERLVVQYTF